MKGAHIRDWRWRFDGIRGGGATWLEVMRPRGWSGRFDVVGGGVSTWLEEALRRD